MPEFKVGDLVRVKRIVSFPRFTLTPGELGVVIEVKKGEGINHPVTCIRLDTHYPELDDWENVLYVYPTRDDRDPPNYPVVDDFEIASRPVVDTKPEEPRLNFEEFTSAVTSHLRAIEKILDGAKDEGGTALVGTLIGVTMGRAVERYEDPDALLKHIGNSYSITRSTNFGLWSMKDAGKTESDGPGDPEAEGSENGPG